MCSPKQTPFIIIEHTKFPNPKYRIHSFTIVTSYSSKKNKKQNQKRKNLNEEFHYVTIQLFIFKFEEATSTHSHAIKYIPMEVNRTSSF